MGLLVGISFMGCVLPNGRRRRGVAHVLDIRDGSRSHTEGSFAVDEGRGPEVGPEVGTQNRTIGHTLDSDTKLCRAKGLPGHIPKQAPIAFAPEEPLKCSDGTRENGTNISHEEKFMLKLDVCKAFGAYSKNKQTGDYLDMRHEFDKRGQPIADIWPQRVRFKAVLDAYMKNNGVTQGQVAKKLGVSLTHLQNCLYRPEKRLGIDTLIRASALFVTPVTEFIDDPGSPLLGEDISGLSEMQRFQLKTMLYDMKHGDIPEDEWRRLLGAYIFAVQQARTGKGSGGGR